MNFRIQFFGSWINALIDIFLRHYYVKKGKKYNGGAGGYFFVTLWKNTRAKK